jgi:hypothetical protein
MLSAFVDLAARVDDNNLDRLERLIAARRRRRRSRNHEHGASYVPIRGTSGGDFCGDRRGALRYRLPAVTSNSADAEPEPTRTRSARVVDGTTRALRGLTLLCILPLGLSLVGCVDKQLDGLLAGLGIADRDISQGHGGNLSQG